MPEAAATRTLMISDFARSARMIRAWPTVALKAFQLRYDVNTDTPRLAPNGEAICDDYFGTLGRNFGHAPDFDELYHPHCSPTQKCFFIVIFDNTRAILERYYAREKRHAAEFLLRKEHTSWFFSLPCLPKLSQQKRWSPFAAREAQYTMFTHRRALLQLMREISHFCEY